MDILIAHHSTKRNEPHEYDDCHMKDIIDLKDMPKHISIDCEFMEHVSLQGERLHVYLQEMPGRIDYCRYLETIYILSTKEVEFLSKPYSPFREKKKVSTLWELGEREQVTLEEVGELCLT